MMKKTLTILALTLLTLCLYAQDGPQIYNMNFDTWSKSSGAWNLYPANASAAQKGWDTANHGLSILGINGTLPEYKHVAVPGEGKAAAKIISKKVVWAFVAGNLYTGWFGRIVKLSGAELNFGIPFNARPKSMSGYFHYIPATVDYAREPYLDMKGKTDVGRIEVILTDWEKPNHIITNYEKIIDGATDPHVIGIGTLELRKDTGGYIHFDIPIRYRSDKTPRYVVITAASSWYGAYFTGGSGSTLYVDEFQFNY